MSSNLRIAVVSLALAAQAASQIAAPDPSAEPGAGAPIGQQPGGGVDVPVSLHFTVAADATELTASGSGGTSLRFLTDEDVAVIDEVGASTSAETFLGGMNWQALFGDADADDEFHQDPLAGSIDALVFCGGDGPLDLFISPSQTIGTGPNALHPGDVGRPRHDGVIDYLIRGDQLKAALDIDLTKQINVDGFAIDADGSIYLSLEDAEFTLGGIKLLDGDILWIPHTKIFWEDCKVADVIADAGLVLFAEAQVDAMVVHSHVSDTVGVAVTSVGDVDGLEVDPANTLAEGVNNPPGAFARNLLLCGLNLVGGAVLTTADGGSVAVVSGHPLASVAPGPTTGDQVGLAPAAHSLNGLALAGSPPYRFVLDSDTPTPAAGMVIRVAWGGTAGLTEMVLGANLYKDAELAAGDSLPSKTELGWVAHRFYLADILTPVMPMGGADFGQLALAYAPIPAATGCVLVVQGLAVDATKTRLLSAPVALQF